MAEQELSPDDFPAFFEAIHGYLPFDWQKRLASDVLKHGKRYDVIQVPTACGKTSLLDVALFEMALEASRQSDPKERTVPRRICFVIDRRLVVDEATDHARTLLSAIVEAVQGKRSDAVLTSVAHALGTLACDATEPLRVVRLRGGVYRDDGWAGDPLTPTILISTVDQIGSRLLFRGYGVSQRTRPIHAGLLAFDTRIILDEAHLSTTFAETLRAMGHYQTWAESHVVPQSRRVSLLRMSATAGESENSFELSEDDRRDEKLKPRLSVPKIAQLVEVPVDRIKKDERNTRKGREQEQRNRAAMVAEIVKRAWSLANIGSEKDRDGPPPRVVGIVVNRVATARQVFEKLRSQDDVDGQHDAILLTGRIRPYDRDRLLDDWLPMIKAKRDAQPEKTLFVVATQTVEVGANLDFDALVTEAAPLDALRQRFGRLFRIPDQPSGRPESARAVVLMRSDQKGVDADDAVYGSSVGRCWQCLNDLATNGTVDFGVNQMDNDYEQWQQELPNRVEQELQRKQLQKQKKAKKKKAAKELADELKKKVDETLAIRSQVTAPQLDAPLLLPAHLEAWAQTSPPPTPDPDVAPFLHGRADVTADVQVVWRADLDEKRQEPWGRMVSLMPPRSREALPIPLYAVEAWLNRIDTYQQVADVADVEGGSEPESSGRPRHRRRVLRWRGRKDRKVVDSGRLKPGDTIVVPASYGGADAFGWNPEATQTVTDVADSCLSGLVASYPEDAFRRPELRLRLHPSLMPADDPGDWQRLLRLIRSATIAANNDASDPLPVIEQTLNTLASCISDPIHHAAIHAMVGSLTSLKCDLYPDHSGLVLRASISLEIPDAGQIEQEYEEAEDDESSTLRTRLPVELACHTEGVRATAKAFARGCGLDERLVEALDRVGLWHDQGKRDLRFQSWLHGGELKALQALAADQPLAKSGRGPKSWQSSEVFGYPNGSRHEFVSVRLLEKSNDFSNAHSDLLKFLIGTHHGYGRPWPPVVDDPNPVQVQLTHEGRTLDVSSDHGFHRIDGGWVDLFWQMVHRYGVWGLAYLEAVFVTADRHTSAVEQQGFHQDKNGLE